MGLFDVFSSYGESHGEYQEAHKASISHELLAAAASYEAAKAYEQHVASQGRPDSHAKAKELLAGFAGGFIDREIETRGLDFIDTQRAKRQARGHVEESFTEDVYATHC